MKFVIKQRVMLFVWNVFFSLFITGIVYIGLESIQEYLSFPNVLTYSSLAFSALLCPLFFLPVMGFFFEPIFKGCKSSESFQSKLAKVVLLSAAIILILTIAFRAIYTNQLEDKGYLKCKGIPTGWMPGMATQYVTDLLLCD